jgi:hypothetical protein
VIPGERIYLIPYYHQLLKKGPLAPGEIISPLDREGEWLRQGILYHTLTQDWVIVAVKTATRESLITLMQRAKERNKPNLKMVQACLKAEDTVIQAAEKLGISVFKYPTDPKLPPIPCSTCGTQIDPAVPPWRCKDCAEAFSGEYRLVICHKCALPFRTVPNLEHQLAEKLKGMGVWRVEILCPDCRLSSEQEALLKFDGTLKSLIFWALLRGHISIEGLAQMGVPNDYISHVIRPEFLKLIAPPKGPESNDAARAAPTMVSGAQQGTGAEVLAEGAEGSTVSISTNLAAAMGATEVAAIPSADLVELEIEALNAAYSSGIGRELNEDPQTYLDRVHATPPSRLLVEEKAIIEAIEDTLEEAYRRLPKERLESLFRAEGDVAGELSRKVGISQEPGESLARYLNRLKTLLSQRTSAEESDQPEDLTTRLDEPPSRE